MKRKHAFFAFAIPIVIAVLLGLVGFGIIPGGEVLYYVSIYITAVVLALAAALTLGNKRHTQGNEDVAPAIG